MNQKDQNNKTVQSEKVFKWWDYPLFILLTGLSFSAISYFMWYWFFLKDWLYYQVPFSIMALMLIAFLANNQGRWFLLLYMRRPKPMTVRPGWKVGVVTTFVPGAEPLEMLEETLKALIALDYPHDTWVLDEGDDDQVKILCQKLDINHFSRKNLPQYQTESGIFQSRSKHGNYNAWLYEIGFNRYEIITALDPDHVPDPAFLSNVLGYFEDGKVGYVQVAQAYYNQKSSFIARGAAEETYAYYSSIQMANYALGYPIIVGCHNTHRVSALEQVGGFAPRYGEDLLTTLFYRACGWQGIYVPKILARGLAPVDWSGYLTQQRGWARVILDIKFRIYPKLQWNLPFGTHVISFLHGLNYLHRSFIIFTGLILTAYMLATGVTPKVISLSTLPRLALLCVVLQICEFYRQRFYLDWRNEWGFYWRAGLLQFAKWPYFLLALSDFILGLQVYALTRKVKSRTRNYMLFWPHMVVAVLMCIAWIIGMVSGHIINPLLHICAAIIVVGSLALILTEHLNFPDPYNKSLRTSANEALRN